MSTKIIKAAVTELVAKELKLSYEQFPAFNSPHEGYAVILEEVEEAADDLKAMQTYLSYAWNNIKSNYLDIKVYLDEVEITALNAACECIQVAAMCQKYRKSLLSNGD